MDLRSLLVSLPLALTLGCPSSSALDAPTGSDSPSGVDAPSSGGDAPAATGYCPEAMFPTDFARSCGAPGDCFVASHLRDCCGGTVLMGIALSEEMRFDAAEARVSTLCAPTCECLSSVILEDGTAVSNPSIIFADCVSGLCVARFPTR